LWVDKIRQALTVASSAPLHPPTPTLPSRGEGAGWKVGRTGPLTGWHPQAGILSPNSHHAPARQIRGPLNSRSSHAATTCADPRILKFGACHFCSTVYHTSVSNNSIFGTAEARQANLGLASRKVHPPRSTRRLERAVGAYPSKQEGRSHGPFFYALPKHKAATGGRAPRTSSTYRTSDP
jgi:hypothetical protein